MVHDPGINERTHVYPIGLHQCWGATTAAHVTCAARQSTCGDFQIFLNGAGSQIAYAPGPGVVSTLSLQRLALPKLLMGAVRPRVLAWPPMDGVSVYDAGPGE